MPGRGPAEPAGHRDDVAGLCAGARDRLVVAHVAERGDRDGDGVTANDIASDDGGARDLALVAQAVHQLVRPAGGEFGGDHEAEQERGRDGAHGGDVREVLRGGLAPDVVGRGPVAAEVPPFEEDVRAHDDPAVRRGHHGRVVARAESYGRGGGEPGGELSDEPELAQLADGALHARTAPSAPVRLRSRAVSVIGTVIVVGGTVPLTGARRP